MKQFFKNNKKYISLKGNETKYFTKVLVYIKLEIVKDSQIYSDLKDKDSQRK